MKDERLEKPEDTAVTTAEQVGPSERKPIQETRFFPAINKEKEPLLSLL